MNKEKAINILNHISDYVKYDTMEDEVFISDKLYDAAETAITALEAQQADRWIPVTERLPEEPECNKILENKPLELYLVTEKDSDYPFRAFWNGKIFTDGRYKVDAIAWIPLPEPWKEEQ